MLSSVLQLCLSPPGSPALQQGNVEYKLKLTQISPARFARLVTQLKWRLLEGGGQAYYELGVADSGSLIGLTRADVEESLETLEMMAGEIGASVIVVKEIEVPPVLVAMADKLSGYLDPDTGEWADKMSSKRSRPPRSDWEEVEDATESETETGVFTADYSDEEDSLPLMTPARSCVSPHPGVVSSAPSVNSNPVQPSSVSSQLDDDLALFSMEPEPEFDNSENQSPVADPDVPDTDPDLWVYVGLAVAKSSVYKVRPGRKGSHVMNAAVGHFGKRAHKLRQKKVHPWHGTSPPGHAYLKGDQDDSKAKELKAHNRRIARDKRREERRKTSHVASEIAASPPSAASSVPADASVQGIETVTDSLVSGLEALHVTAEIGPEASHLLPRGDDSSTAEDDLHGHMGSVAQAIEGKLSGSSNLEPRLIVEALVVRKLSIDEGLFDLDLNNFVLS